MFRARFEVLEQCDFIWLPNDDNAFGYQEAVLEQCDFIWLPNRMQYLLRKYPVLEQCDFIWLPNMPDGVPAEILF